MKNREKNRRNYGSNSGIVERNHQNRYYRANEASDIYENEFQDEDEINEDEEDNFGNFRNSLDHDDDYRYQQEDGDIDRELFEHQRSNTYVSNNPRRLRKNSKRRFVSEAEKRKRRRNHLIMENLRVSSQRA